MENNHSAEEAPKGTFALMLILAVLMVGAWAYMYFFQFLAHGPVS